MADKISNLFFDENMNFDCDKYQNWIKIFLIEFIKKWPKIDFHRMDKYIMLLQTILKRYFEIHLLNQNFDILINFFELISLCITGGNYNFSFMSIILKLISFFIDDIFKNQGDVEIKRKFLQNYFFEFFEQLLKVIYKLR